jgi:hypothetical protein
MEKDYIQHELERAPDMRIVTGFFWDGDSVVIPQMNPFVRGLLSSEGAAGIRVVS